MKKIWNWFCQKMADKYFNNVVKMDLQSDARSEEYNKYFKWVDRMLSEKQEN
jgi:hypothetical protein